MAGRTTTGVPPTRAFSRRRRRRSFKDNALEAVKGLLPGSGRKPAATSRSAGKNAKAGVGVAVLTAAAGAAFKNRDKLTSLLKRRGDSPSDLSSVEQAPPVPGDAATGASGPTPPESPHKTPTSLEDLSSQTSPDEPPPMREPPN
jgi:hypothetical protein